MWATNMVDHTDMWSKITKRNQSTIQINIRKITTTRTKQIIYEAKIKYVNQETENDEKLEKYYSVIWRQLTGTIKRKLRSCEKYEDIRYAKDTI